MTSYDLNQVRSIDYILLQAISMTVHIQVGSISTCFTAIYVDSPGGKLGKVTLPGLETT